MSNSQKWKNFIIWWNNEFKLSDNCSNCSVVMQIKQKIDEVRRKDKNIKDPTIKTCIDNHIRILYETEKCPLCEIKKISEKSIKEIESLRKCNIKKRISNEK